MTKQEMIEELILEAAIIIEDECPRSDPRYETSVKLRKLLEEKMDIKKSTSKKLIMEAQRLYDGVENDGGFSSCDVLVLESIRAELERRGYVERLTITFVK